MKKLLLVMMVLSLSGCDLTDEPEPITCDDGYSLIESECVQDDDTNPVLLPIAYPAPAVTIVTTTDTSVRFKIVIPENRFELILTGLTLVQGDTSIVLEDLTTRSIDTLQPGTQYELEYTYTHWSDDGEELLEYTFSLSFQTEEQIIEAPSVSIVLINDPIDTAYFRFDVTDPSDVIVIDGITLWNGDTIVDQYDYNNYLFIMDLLEMSDYDITLDYHYDLGDGPVSDTVTTTFSTGSRAIAYLIDIALGFEFGTAPEITRKWTTPMKIYVDGTPSEELLDELDRILVELNGLFTDGFSIEIVESKAMSNFQVVFSSAQYYETTYDVSPTYTTTNWGLFYVWWDGENNLNRGHMYVDIERASLAGQKHLRRE